MKKPSPAVKEGIAAGAWLADRAAFALRSEFDRRPGAASMKTDAIRALDHAITTLKRSLGASVDNSDVSGALHALDGAIWDVVVDHEDRAWHAAWALAMNLRGK